MVYLYNTATRKIEKFKPLKPKKVGIYSCGPTVYWNQHIGNMYAYLQWDILVRALKFLGYKVKWVMNITDVGHLTSDEDTGEDKMEKGARREGLTVWQIAEKYIKQFTESLDLLNIQRPDIMCRATDHIPEQINLIKKMERRGFTYRTETGLVFDTAKFPDYAKFARLNLKKQYAGSRVEVDPQKKKPWDFLLWVTNQPNHIMQWDSPWGKGFPGWHIECTAMSTKYLGHRFDIHTGGVEHIPVHHTNEVAQGFGAFGKPTANYWLHNAWMLLNKEKISKSLGNIILVTDLIAKGYNPLSLRYLALTSHYRQGLNFTWEGLNASQKALENLSNRILDLKTENREQKTENKEQRTKNNLTIKKYRQRFAEFISDNLNMPKALALAWQVLKDKKLTDQDKYRLLIDFDKVFGLKLAEAETPKTVIPPEVEKLVHLREQYRQEENWQEADNIREKIKALGWQIEDTPAGPKAKPL